MALRSRSRLRLSYLMAMIAICAGGLAYNEDAKRRLPINQAIRDLRVSNTQGRLQALQKLAGMGPKAKPAIPALQASLKDPDPQIRDAAIGVLVGLNAPSDALTLALIESKITRIPQFDRWSYGMAGGPDSFLDAQPIPPQGIQRLRDALNSGPNVDDHNSYRWFRDNTEGLVLRLAKKPGTNAKLWLPLMMDLLGPEKPSDVMTVPTLNQLYAGLPISLKTRIEAAQWIAIHAPEAKSQAVSSLLHDLNDLRPAYSWPAAEVLANLAPEKDQALPTLLQRLKSGSIEERLRTGFALELLRPEPNSVVEAITDAMLARDADVTSYHFIMDLQFNNWDGNSVFQRFQSRMNSPSVQSIQGLCAHLLKGYGSAEEQLAAKLLVKAVDDDNPERRRLALSALRAMGAGAKPAIPRLIEITGLPPGPSHQLRDASWSVKMDDSPATQAVETLKQIVRSVPIIEEQVTYEGNVRVSPLPRKNDPVPPEVIEAFIDVLDGPDDMAASAAATALGDFGTDARAAGPALARAAMPGRNQGRRTSALRAIGQIGADSKLAGPVLMAAMQDHEWDVRSAATVSLPCLGQAAKPCVPKLILLLYGDQNVSRREAIVKSLEALGPSAARAGPAILSMAIDPDKYNQLRPSCAFALEAIFPDRAVLEGVASAPDTALESPDSVIRGIAAYQLGKSSESHPQLIQALRDDPDPFVRAAAAVSLGLECGRATPGSVDALNRALDDAKTVVRLTAAQALGKHGAGADGATRALVRAVRRDPEASVRIESIHALLKVGKEQRSLVVNALIDAAGNDTEPNVRDWSLYTLGELSPPFGLILPTVIAGTRDPIRSVRGAAVVALAKIGAKGSPDAVLPAILEGLDGIPWDYRFDLGSSLARWKYPEVAFVALRERLVHGDRRVRETALQAMDAFPAALRVTGLPELAAALDDPDPDVRRTAAQSLRYLGRLAAPVEPALRRALDHEDRNVRISAIDAVRAIVKNEQPIR